MIAIASCLELFMHEVAWARAFALLSAGNNMLARIAMIAMTTSNSINVKPGCPRRQPALPAAPLFCSVFIDDLLFRARQPEIRSEERRVGKECSCREAVW